MHVYKILIRYLNRAVKKAVARGDRDTLDKAILARGSLSILDVSYQIITTGQLIRQFTYLRFDLAKLFERLFVQPIFAKIPHQQIANRRNEHRSKYAGQNC